MDEPTRFQAPKPDTREAAAMVSRVWQEFAANAAEISAARRTLFLAYVAEGFSEAQALELIKQL